MNVRPSSLFKPNPSQNPNNTILGNEIYNQRRITLWAAFCGLLSCCVLAKSYHDAKNNNDTAAGILLALSVFTSSMWLGLKAEDRQAKSARALNQGMFSSEQRKPILSHYPDLTTVEPAQKHKRI